MIRPIQETSDGPRPLATRAYYARLTQAVVTALSAQMSEGRMYEVDMRLRPSGKQGPVATSLDGFRNYQMTEAWTWEHLALTRARVVAGAPSLGEEIEGFRKRVLTDKGQGPTVLPDVAEMRARIADAKTGGGDWDVKIGPGRLQDAELFAQTAALQAGSDARGLAAQLQAGVDAGWIAAGDARVITDAAALFWKVQAAARLLSGGQLDPAALGEGGRRFVLRETEFATMDELLAAIQGAATKTDDIISRKLGGTDAKGPA